MITIDGAAGEGGGQILRSSLSLSLVTGKPFQMLNIRANRKKPGLRAQHLTAVRAAGRISGAAVSGDHIGSERLQFRPGPVQPGDYHFSPRTAGSVTLILQTLLPPLMIAPDESRIILEGGTHNPMAPPFDFLAAAFLPLMNRMGPTIVAGLDRYGFYPAGGGRIAVTVSPTKRLGEISLLDRGCAVARSAEALLANLPLHIGEREINVVRDTLGWPESSLRVTSLKNVHGHGNVILLKMAFEHVTELFVGFGERGLPAEEVARQAVGKVLAYLDSAAPVGEYLADQLLLPMAMAGKGAIHTMRLTAHSLTNMDVIRRFLPVQFRVEQEKKDCLVEVREA